MSNQDIADRSRATADQILDDMNNRGFENDPTATLRDAGVNPESTDQGDDVGGYGMPLVPSPMPPAPTPPYEGGGEKGGAVTDPPPYPPAPTPPGSGTETGTTDVKPANW